MKKRKPENKKLNHNYNIMLFYKYAKLEDPEAVMHWQRSLCEKHGILGRIIVAHEGINAILEGTNKACRAYWKEFKKYTPFADTERKDSVGTGYAFPRLSVKVKPELVNLGLGEDDLDPNEFTGKRLNPEELRAWYENNDDFEIIDMRNDYEYEVGHFEGSTLPSFKNFRDLPKLVDEMEHLKDKKVLTVCTGGVRCEKASGYLRKKGFKDVYQLHGGIHKYMEKYPGQDWKGTLYTFDGRVVMDFDGGNHEVIGTCLKCKGKTEEYRDCANLQCHRHYLECEDCLENGGGEPFCSVACKDKVLATAK